MKNRQDSREIEIGTFDSPPAWVHTQRTAATVYKEEFHENHEVRSNDCL